jgi:putative transposase
LKERKSLSRDSRSFSNSKKGPSDLGGPRGRLISTSDREIAVQLIDEVRAAGARLKPACNILDISERTYQRWTKDGRVKEDLRPTAHRPSPKNKLIEKEREKVIKVANSPEFDDLPPCKIVPKIAKGEYSIGINLLSYFKGRKNGYP